MRTMNQWLTILMGSSKPVLVLEEVEKEMKKEAMQACSKGGEVCENSSGDVEWWVCADCIEAECRKSMMEAKQWREERELKIEEAQVRYEEERQNIIERSYSN